MATIEERVARIRFDNEGFAKKAQETISALDKLSEKLKFKKVEDPFKGITVSASQVDFSQIDQGLATITNRMTLLQSIGTQAMMKLSNSIVNLGTNLVRKLGDPISQIWNGGIRRAMNIEDSKFKLEGLGVTGDELAKVWENVDAAVSGTAYSLDAAALVAAQLAASGMRGGEKMANALRGISGVAAVTSSSYEDIGRIFTQVAGQGKLMGDQLLQLSGRGMNAAAELARQMGITEAEVRDMVSKGKIDFQTFADAMNYAFGDQAMKANDTLNGVMSNIRSAWAKIGADLVTPFITNTSSKDHESNLVELLNQLRESINLLRPAMKPLFDVLQNYGLKAVQGMTEGIKLFNKLTAPLTETIKETKTVTVETVEEIDQALEDLARTVIRGDWGNGAERMRRLTEAGHDYAKTQNIVNEMVWGTYTGMKKTTKTVEETTETVQRATGAFVDFRESIARGFGNLIQSVLKPLETVLTDFGDVFKMEDLVKVINMVSYAFDRITSKFIISDRFAQKLHDSLVVIFTGIRTSIQMAIPVFDFLLRKFEDLLDIARAFVSFGFDVIFAPFDELFRLMEKFSANEKFISSIASIGESFSLIWESLGLMKDSVLEASQAFFEAFDGPFKDFADWFDKIRNAAEDGFVNLVASALELLAKWISIAAKGFNDLVKKSAPNIVSFGKKAGTAISNFYKDHLKPCIDFISELISKIWEWTTHTAGEISSWCSEAIGGITDWIKKAISPAIEKLGDFTGAIWDWTSGTAGRIDNWSKSAIQSVRNWFNQTAPGFTTWAKSSWDTLSKWTGDTFKTITKWSSDTLKVIGEWVKYAADKIGPWLSDMGKMFTEKFEGIIETFRGWYDQLKPHIDKFCEDSVTKMQGWNEDMKEAMDGAGTFMFTIFDGTGNPFENLIQNIVDGINKINLRDIFIGFFTGIGTGIDNAYNSVEPVVKKTFTFTFKKLFDTAKGPFWDSVKEFTGTTVPTAMENATDALVNFTNKINDSVDKLDLKAIEDMFWTIANGAMTISGIKALWQLGDMFKGIKTAADSFGKIGKSISGFIDSFKNPAKSKPEKVAAMVDTYARAFVKIATSLGMLALFDTNKIWTAIGQLATIVGMIGALSAVFGSDFKITNKLFGNMDNITNFAKVVDTMGSALLKLAFPIAILGALPYGMLQQGLSTVKSLIWELAVSISLMGLTTKKVDPSIRILKDLSNALIKLLIPIAAFGLIPWQIIVKGMGFLAVELGGLLFALAQFTKHAKKGFKTEITFLKDLSNSLIKLIVPIIFLGNMDWWHLVRGLFGTGVALGLLVGAIWGITKITSNGELAKVAKVILAFGTALLMLTVPVLVFGTMNWQALLQGGVAVAALLVALGGAGYWLGNANGSIKEAAGLILSMSVSLLLLSIPIKVLGEMDLGQLGIGLVSVGACLLAMVGALAAISKWGKAGGKEALAMIAMSTSLFILAGAVYMLQGLSWGDVWKGITVLGAGLTGLIFASSIAEAASVGLLALGSAAAGIGAGLLMGAAAIWVIIDALQKLANSTPEQCRNVVQCISAFGDELNKEAFNLAKNFVSSLIQGLVGAVVGAIEGVGKTILNVGGTVLGWVGDGLGAIGSWLGIGGEGNKEIKQSGTEYGEALVGGVKSGIDGGEKEVTTSTEGLLAMASSNAQMAATNAGNLVAERLQDGVNDGLSEGEIDPNALSSAMMNTEGADQAGGFNAESMISGMEQQLRESGLDEESIASFMSTINMDGLGEEQADLFSSNFVDNMDFSGVMENVDFSSITSSFGDLGAGLPSILGSGFSENTGPMNTEIQNSMDVVPQLMEEKEPQIQEAGGKAMTAYSGAMATAVEDTVKPQIDIIGQDIANRLDENNKTVIKDAGIKGAQAYSDGFSEQTADYLVPAITNMSTTIQESLDGVSTTFENTGIDSGARFVDGVWQKNEAVTQVGVDITNSLARSVEDSSYLIENSGLYLGDKVANGVKAGIERSTNLVLDTIDALVRKIDERKSSYETVGKDSGDIYIKNLQERTSVGMKSVVDTITTSVKELMDKSIDVINNAKTRFEQGGKTIMNALNSGIREIFTTIKSSVNEVLFQAASSCYKYDSFYHAGVDCMVGFVNGMNSMSGSVYRTAYNIGHSALTAAKEAVDSNSPSKEFMKLGQYNDEGLILGMNSKAKEVEKSAGKVSRSAFDAMAEAFMKFDSIDANANPVITPVVDLTNVENAQGRIGSLLGMDPNAVVDLRAIFGEADIANNVDVNVDVKVDNSEVAKIIGELREDLNGLKSSMTSLKVYMDSGRLVGEIIDEVDTKLGFKQSLKMRGG